MTTHCPTLASPRTDKLLLLCVLNKAFKKSGKNRSAPEKGDQFSSPKLGPILGPINKATIAGAKNGSLFWGPFLAPFFEQPGRLIFKNVSHFKFELHTCEICRHSKLSACLAWKFTKIRGQVLGPEIAIRSTKAADVRLASSSIRQRGRPIMLKSLFVQFSFPKLGPASVLKNKVPRPALRRTAAFSRHSLMRIPRDLYGPCHSLFGIHRDP